MSLPMKQKHTQRHREQTCGCQGERRVEEGWAAVWDQQMQSIIHRTDKQQGPTVQHRELHSISCDKASGKEDGKESYITESLC